MKVIFEVVLAFCLMLGVMLAASYFLFVLCSFVWSFFR